MRWPQDRAADEAFQAGVGGRLVTWDLDSAEAPRCLGFQFSASIWRSKPEKWGHSNSSFLVCLGREAWFLPMTERVVSPCWCPKGKAAFYTVRQALRLTATSQPAAESKSQVLARARRDMVERDQAQAADDGFDLILHCGNHSPERQTESSLQMGLLLPKSWE